ncbi:MAG: PEP-CTERM sorting domain-containing protein [Phycisphaerae bacterium]
MLKIATVSALFLSCAGGASRAAVTLSFDNFPGATNISNGADVPTASILLYDHFQSAYGLQITAFNNSLNPFDGVGVAEFGSAAPSPPNAVVGINGFHKFNYAAFLAFKFVDPAHPSQNATTDYFSLQNPVNSGQSITMYAFDLSDHLLGSTTHISDGTATWTLALPGMHVIRYGDPTTNPIFAADNVTFNALPAPEPSTLALLASGTLLVPRRRRHHPIG